MTVKDIITKQKNDTPVDFFINEKFDSSYHASQFKTLGENRDDRLNLTVTGYEIDAHINKMSGKPFASIRLYARK